MAQNVKDLKAFGKKCRSYIYRYAFWGQSKKF